MKATRYILSALLVVLVSLAVGCGGGGGKSTPPTCDDGLWNGDETDVDCGGECGFCQAGGGCASDGDCRSKICGDDLKCAAAACDDGILNGYETDLDCGGSCPGCIEGKMCRVGPNCLSGSCQSGICSAPTCEDGAQNGDELGIDCGGTCGPCPAGTPCTAPEDCLSGVCGGGLCQPPSCEDENMNGDETGVDCGGWTCEACPATEGCVYDRDCLSGVCLNELCQEPNCFDGVANGEELGVDCAGPCDACPGGQPCVIDLDCLSIRCTEGICEAPNCADNLHNGDETDVDCGGSCSPCAFSNNCVDHSDCSGGICGANSRCAYGESCSHILSAAPEARDGLYQIDPEQDSYLPLWAFCDMTTDGGGWTLVLNYVHLAGTNPQLYNSPDKLPWMVATDLGSDEQGTYAWRHTQNVLFATLPVEELRFYGMTSAHGRVLHFKTTMQTCINYFATGSGSCAGLENRYLPLAGHTTMLPDWANAFNSDQGNQAMTNQPFYNDDADGDEVVWAIHGDESDWSMDHIRAGGGFDTLHQIWVRAEPSHCSDGTQNFSEKDTDCGGQCADCVDGSTCTADEDCLGLCMNDLCESLANCTEIKLVRPAAPDGHYQIDVDGLGGVAPMQAYCDMTTDGGGWTMVLNYMHQADTDPGTPMLNAGLPLKGSDRLGKDEGGTPYFAHTSPALTALLSPAEIRFYGTTSAHDRVLHFATDSEDCIGYFTGDADKNCGDLTRNFTLMTDHSAVLPAAMNGVARSSQDEELLVRAPFVSVGRAMWNVGAGGWQVDDWTGGITNHTIHRVFVRSEPMSCSSTELDGDETDVDCGGSCSMRCGPGLICVENSDCQSGLCDQGTCALARDCSNILWGNPTAQSGEYLVDVDEDDVLEPMLAYCDMETDGGGWMLVGNYLHQSGTAPVLVPLTDMLPLRGSDLLGPDESGRPEYWGHAGNALFASLDVAELRFNGYSSSNDRLLDFVTTNESCIEYLALGTNTDGCLGVAKDHRVLPGHSSMLPQVTDAAVADRGDNAMIDHTFWRSYGNHWVVGSRFDVDDWSEPATANHTLHRVWVRAAPPLCESGVADGDEEGVDCGGSCPTPCAKLAEGEACTGHQQCVTGVCASGVCTLAASCSEILANQPLAQNGDYQIDPDGLAGLDPFYASCDMVTDGGGWMLVGNYMHQGGTDPALVALSVAPPLWGSNVLGTDESADGQHWGHTNNALFTALGATEVRFEGVSRNVNRIVHFSSSQRECINYLGTGEGDCRRLGGHHRLLPGQNAHPSYLAYTPWSMDTAWDGTSLDTYASNGRDDAMMAFPFYLGGLAHWGAGTLNRWEVDDYAGNAAYHTMHRVWVRSCPQIMYDDFNDLVPEGWTFVDQAGVSGSAWEIRADGVLMEPSNANAAGRMGTIALWDDPAALAWDDYRLHASVYNSDNDGIGVIFRYQDEDNYYKLDLDQERQFRRLYRMKDGERTLVASDEGVPVTTGHWYFIEVAVKGNTIQAWLNGAEILDGLVYDQDGLTQGTIAMFDWGSQTTYFDDVSVFEICH